MDIQEELRRWLALLTQLAGQMESKQIKAFIDLLMGVVGQLTAELANRNSALAKQCQQRKVKSPKSRSQKGPQRTQPSTTDAQKEQDRSDNRYKISAIQQGIRQADSTLVDQQRAIRQQIYGPQNSDVAFAKAAKVIAS